MLGADYPFDLTEPNPVDFLGRIEDVSDDGIALMAAATPNDCWGGPPRRPRLGKIPA